MNYKFDTIKVKAIYIDVTENVYYAPYKESDIQNQFYKKLQDKYKYGLNLCLVFKLLNCDTGYSYPYIYKSKYDYKLFHRKNKNGDYEDWIQDKQIVELTIVRYNRYFPHSNDFITIIQDITPIEETEKINK
jgi:hypothetical protein